MKKVIAVTLVLVLALSVLFVFAGCSSKDALAGTWTGDLGADGIVTWKFDGKGGCEFENEFAKQTGTYTIEGDQVTVMLELWSDPTTYNFAVSGSTLTMDDVEGVGLSGTFEKQ